MRALNHKMSFSSSVRAELVEAFSNLQEPFDALRANGNKSSGIFVLLTFLGNLRPEEKQHRAPCAADLLSVAL
jgi:hypothetical protein